jgi:hypothetical protein
MQESIETLRTELEERLSLAADSARAHLWHLGIDPGRIWTTEKAKEFFGFSLDRELDLESFLNMVHPKDRKKLRLTVEEGVQSGEDIGALNTVSCAPMRVFGGSCPGADGIRHQRGNPPA